MDPTQKLFGHGILGGDRYVRGGGRASPDKVDLAAPLAGAGPRRALECVTSQCSRGPH